MRRRGLARFTTAEGPRDAATGPRAAGNGPGTTTAPEAGGAPGVTDDGATTPPEVAPALARFLSNRPPPTPGEACDLCAEPVPAEHRHIVDLERRSLLCTCRGCSLLFSGEVAGRYRMVPDRYLWITPFVRPSPAWASLQIPVGIAFVVSNTQLGKPVAFYPSPGGATESELELDAWRDVVAANPGLGDVEPDVEAVLVRTGAGDPRCFVVPVDRCYELVGALRLHWRGFDGGQEVREHIAAFFADVERRSRRRSRDAGDGPARRPASSSRADGGGTP